MWLLLIALPLLSPVRDPEPSSVAELAKPNATYWKGDPVHEPDAEEG